MLKSVYHAMLALPATALFAGLVGATELPGPLVDAEWLMDNQDEVLILDVRKDLLSYAADGHIEGAVLVNTKKVRNGRTVNGLELTRMLPVREQYIDFMQQHGVSTDSVVVITHKGETAGNVAGAARLYWQMKVYGFDQVALLDGGNSAWVEALGDLENEVTRVTPGKLEVSTQNQDIVASIADVEAALSSDDTVLVDTRGLRFHIGLEKRSYVYAYGHIPDSRLMPYNFLHPQKGTAKYLPVEASQQALASLRIEDDKQVILYCNSAYEASSVWFHLHELLGKKNVKVYDGSLHEWTSHAGYPMTRQITAFTEPYTLSLKE